MTFTTPRLGILIFCLLLSGCGDGRLSLKGSVSINGTPIQEGAITFQPVVGTSEFNTSTGAAIINGRYSVAAKRGLIPGEYRVTIVATEDTGQVDARGSSIHRNIVPPKYSDNSELTISVTKGKSYDFDLVVNKEDFQNVPFAR